jgi:nicotinamidase-related amidase
MKIQREDTAIVFIDPQNEVLSEKGLAWPLVRESLQENNTIENMERIFKAAKAHLRELLEQGFEVAVAKDATAAPKHPEWGYGYEAALINYAFLAHAVLTTDQAVKAMEQP